MTFGFGFRRILPPQISPRAQMSQDSGLGCLLMVFVPLLLIASTYLAWWELRFLVQGRPTLATVDGVQEVRMGRSGRFPLYNGNYLEVRYTFQDEPAGRPRSEHDELPLSWPHPEGKVRIQYVSGVPGGSRVEGHRHIYSTIFFVVCVTGAIIYGGLLVRDARRAVREEEAFELARRQERGR